MPKFRKKPIVIEAIQWFKLGDHPAVTAMPGPGAYPEGSSTVQGGQVVGFIATDAGELTVIPGDWIATGTAGEHYPIKPEIFAEIYEAVEG